MLRQGAKIRACCIDHPLVQGGQVRSTYRIIQGFVLIDKSYACLVFCAKMMSMKQILYIIRHGHTEGTQSDLLYGSTELPVTEEGLREVASFADKGHYPDPEGAAVWTSGMRRTEQTLREMYGDIEHLTEPRLKEIDLGIYEMKTAREIMEDEYGRGWLSGEIEDPDFEGGDSHEGFKARVNEGVMNILQRSAEAGKDRVIAVIHGAVITYIMSHAFPGLREDLWDWCPNPGTGYALLIEDGEAVAWEPVGDTGTRVIPV